MFDKIFEIVETIEPNIFYRTQFFQSNEVHENIESNYICIEYRWEKGGHKTEKTGKKGHFKTWKESCKIRINGAINDA